MYIYDCTCCVSVHTHTHTHIHTRTHTCTHRLSYHCTMLSLTILLPCCSMLPVTIFWCSTTKWMSQVSYWLAVALCICSYFITWWWKAKSKIFTFVSFTSCVIVLCPFSFPSVITIPLTHLLFDGILLVSALFLPPSFAHSGHKALLDLLDSSEFSRPSKGSRSVSYM